MPEIREFLAVADPPTLWLCDPYVSHGGITLIHARSSVGKSPFSWELARCISLGIPFLGWRTNRARVLYMEADTPAVMLRPRLRSLPEPVGDWWIECTQGEILDLAEPSQKCAERLHGLQDALRPELVFWNVLRSYTAQKLQSGETVSKFYGSLRYFFPGAAHVVIHHDRKENASTEMASADEEFSGSNAWRDLAQIALHLRLMGPKGKQWMQVEHTKSQGSAQMSPMKVYLDEDGTRFRGDDKRQAFRVLVEQGESREVICRDLEMTRPTYYRWLKDLQ